MPQEITDLDVVAGPPRRVRLGGRIYILPPDLPIETYLKINQAANREDTQPESDQFADLYETLLELFQVHQPRVKRLPIGIVTLLQAIPTIYGPGNASESEPAGRPTKARGGTRSTPRRRASRRSRSSK